MNEEGKSWVTNIILNTIDTIKELLSEGYTVVDQFNNIYEGNGIEPNPNS